MRRPHRFTQFPEAPHFIKTPIQPRFVWLLLRPPASFLLCVPVTIPSLSFSI